MTPESSRRYEIVIRGIHPTPAFRMRELREFSCETPLVMRARSKSRKASMAAPGGEAGLAIPQSVTG